MAQKISQIQALDVGEDEPVPEHLPGWERMQYKSFRKWSQYILSQRNQTVKKLETDFEDGHRLYNLLELLSQQKIGKRISRAKMRIHCINNLRVSFEFMRKERIRLENLGVEDIADGNLKLIMGLIWTLILKYQIGSISSAKGKGGDGQGGRAAGSARHWLLDWLKCIAHYRDVNITNLTTSFQDGMAFNALAHLYNNDVVNYDALDKKNKLQNLQNAFQVLQDEYGVPKLLDAADMAGSEEPDEKSIITYLGLCIAAFEKYEKKAKARGSAGAEGQGKTEANKSYAWGPGVELASTAEKAWFVIQSKDAKGNNLTTGGDNFKVKITGPKGLVDAQITDKRNGTYYVEYSATIPGSHLIDITLEGKHISNSPVVVEVEYNASPLNEAFYKWSTVYGAGTEIASDAEPATFHIQAKNKYGNEVTKGGDNFGVSLRTPGAAGSLESKTVDNNDGTYTVTYQPTAAGYLTGDVTLTGKSIFNCPFNVTVEHNDSVNTQLDPRWTTAFGPGLASADTVQPANFTVVAKNKYGNSIRTGGHKFDIDIAPPSGSKKGTVPKVTTKDNNDGTYSVTYQPVVGGNHSVGISHNGAPIMRSPYRVPVTQTTDPSKSVAFGAGVEVGSTAEPATFTIQAKDGAGNNVNHGADRVRVTVRGPKGSEEFDIDPYVFDNADGTYSVTYQPVVAGAHVVTVEINGAPIFKSPFNVKVDWNAEALKVADPKYSIAYGPGVELASTAEVATFTIEARNAYGNPIKKGGDQFQVTAPGTTGLEVTDNKNGTYGVKYQAQNPGDLEVKVALKGTNISGSPYSVTVDKNSEASQTADARWTTAYGPGREAANTAGPANLTVQAKNKYGNNLNHGGDQVQLKARDAEGRLVDSDVVDNGNGTYSAAYKPISSGAHNVNVTLGGSSINKSPFVVNATQETDPSKCRAFGPGTELASTAEPSVFTIQAVDTAGNPLNRGGDNFRVRVTAPSGGRAATNVVDNHDGTYTVTYHPKAAGPHKIVATLHGKHIANSPLTVLVEQRGEKDNEADAKWSTVHGAGTEIGSTAEKAEFTIRARNKYGNDIPVGGHDFNVELQGPKGSPAVEAEVKDNDNGTYTVTYQATVPGVYVGDTTLGSKSVHNSPFKVLIEANDAAAEEADPKWTSATGPGLDSCCTTEEAPFTVVARNRYGNQLKKGGSDLKFRVKGHRGKAVKSSIKDNGDGTYSAKYQPTAAGNQILELKLDGKPVSKFPKSVAATQITDASKTVARGAGTEVASTAEVAEFIIQAKDAVGNNCNRGGDSFKVSVTSPSGAAVSSKVKDNGDGTYSVRYNPTTAGEHTVAVALVDKKDNSEKPISNSPLKVNVEANSAPDNSISPKWSNIVGPGTELASTAEPAEFAIEARNKYGNRIKPAATPSFDVKIDAPQGSPAIGSTLADNGDGTYKVTYKPALPGAHKVDVKLGGTPLFDSPATVVVEHNTGFHDEADARWSEAVGAGVESIAVGQPAEFKILAKNRYGNPLSTGGADFHCDLKTEGTEKEGVEVVDNNDGTYFVSYTPTANAEHQVEVTLDDWHIHKSPFFVPIGGAAGAAKAVEVEVAPPRADASSSVPFGPGYDSATVGETATFTIQAKDADWNNLKQGGDNFQVGVTAPDGSKAPASITDNGDGTYTVSYTPAVPGNHDVDVTLDGESIAYCPFTVPVKQNTAAENTTISGSGLEKATTTEPAVFTIQAKDKNGNPVTVGGDGFYVTVTPPSGSKPVIAEVTDNGDGTYTVEYQPTAPGDHKVEVFLNNGNADEAVGAPVVVPVTQTTDARKSVAYGPGFEDASTGNPAVFMIRAKDAKGNNVTRGGDKFEAKLVDPSGVSIPATIKDNGNGTYVATLQPNVPGNHVLEITLDGTPISNSGTSINVRQDVDPSKSTLSGSGIEKASTVEPTSFTITAKDKSGNLVPRGGEKFDVKISTSNGYPVDSQIKDNKDGTYTVTYQPLAPGKTTIAVNLNGAPVGNSPVSLDVEAGPATVMSEFEMEVWREINKARMNPTTYAQNLRELVPNYDPATGAFTIPGTNFARQTKEGRKALYEAIRHLESCETTTPLKINETFSYSCRDLVADLGPKGAMGNVMSDGTSPGDRLNKYGRWKGKVTEIINYGGLTAKDVVISWLIDDGLGERPNRGHLLDPEFTVAGISSGPHAQSLKMCVVALAGNYLEGAEPERVPREIKINTEKEDLSFDRFLTKDKSGYLVPVGKFYTTLDKIKVFKEGKSIHIERTVMTDDGEPLTSHFRYLVPFDFDPITVLAKFNELNNDMSFYITKPAGALDPEKEVTLATYELGPTKGAKNEKMDFVSSETDDYWLFEGKSSSSTEVLTIKLKGKALTFITDRTVIGVDEEGEYETTATSKKTISLPFQVPLGSFSLSPNGKLGFTLKVLKPTSKVSPDAQVEIPVTEGDFRQFE